MTCHEIVDFLRHYLDAELPPEQRSRFEEHLGICPSCVDYLRTYQEAVRLGQCVCNDETVDAPEELIQAILAARKAAPKSSGGCA